MSNLVALIVLDGFGLADPGPGNGVALADTPFFDRWWNKSNQTKLVASGLPVGLPKGQMGNSEVGHLNLGAGRTVPQSLTFLDQEFQNDQVVLENKILATLLDPEVRSIHLAGLVSDGGVHSHIDHLKALISQYARLSDKPIYIHMITDGRDTSPKSGADFARELDDFLSDYPQAQIATVVGRYYAMDRDNRWERIEKAYNLWSGSSQLELVSSAASAIKKSYEQGVTDEFIEPICLVHRPLEDGDILFLFNFRNDRLREIGAALLGIRTDFWNGYQKVDGLKVASMMEIDPELEIPYAFALPSVEKPLAEVLSDAGKSQYHAAETEKYPHVTFFFNAFHEGCYEGEEQQVVPSPKVATYDLQPEMSARALTDEVVQHLEHKQTDFLLVNFANPDMVGHTGKLDAVIKACSFVDRCLEEVVQAIWEQDGIACIVADHGNAECMIDENGNPHTAHTTALVPFLVLGQEGPYETVPSGKLGDVAPTLLALMGLEKPEQMTGTLLLKR